MPTIGPRTVAEAAGAGLSGIAIGAGSTFVLEQEETLRTADRLGFRVSKGAFGRRVELEHSPVRVRCDNRVEH